MWSIVLLLGSWAMAAEAVAAPASSQPSAGDRDALLLLVDGPMHLRFHMQMEGKPLDAAREAYLDRLVKALDADGDGKLSTVEWRKCVLLPVPKSTGPNTFLDSLPEKRTVSRSEMLRMVEIYGGGECVRYRQDTSSSKIDGEVFKFLDGDKSGFIERPEMIAAARKILERDEDGDECISFPEFLPPPPAADPRLGLVAAPPDPNARSDKPVPEISSLLVDTNRPDMVRSLLRKYDRNRDMKLTAKEIHWSKEQFATFDGDRDGKLDQTELRQIVRLPIDLELAVEMSGPAKNQPALRVIQTTGAAETSSKRPDYVRLTFTGAVLTIAFRKIDPIQSSIDNAMKEFNRLDTDANGYLEPMETALRPRFQEERLFQAIDVDGDGKIFAEEMQKFIRARGEGHGNTAQVNLYDTGHGFFHALDRNGDGRVSMREMRSAEQSLASMKRTEKSGLGPEEPVRHFHLEFVRGSFQLFGPKDQMISMTPSFEQKPQIGPIWFQRMDRNSDGDLTWNEFLGPRDVFHRLDLDHDGLVDPTEAEKVQE